MRLQILINHYQESLDIVWRLLHSIERQTGINGHVIEILICTDGNEYELIDPGFDKCRFPVRYYVRPHRGVCQTRNTLLDLSDADYLMFCDCDDVFSRADGLVVLFDSAESTGADIIGSDYDIEKNNKGKLSYRVCHKNTTRVHGKIFKRSFLMRQKIRYPDEMPFSGDMYFLFLAYHFTDEIVWLPDNFYVWKWMPESVTRGKPYYSVRTYDRMIQCYVLVMRELIKRGRMDICNDLITSMINTSYIDYYSKQFADAPEDFTFRARASIRSMVEEFYSFYLGISEKERQQNYIKILLSRRTYGPPGKFAGIPGWINNITENHPQE